MRESCGTDGRVMKPRECFASEWKQEDKEGDRLWHNIRNMKYRITQRNI